MPLVWKSVSCGNCPDAWDYTTRFRKYYTGGLNQLLSGGAVFPDAHQDHYPTVTAAGHATILTGSAPATESSVTSGTTDRPEG